MNSPAVRHSSLLVEDLRFDGYISDELLRGRERRASEQYVQQRDAHYDPSKWAYSSPGGHLQWLPFSSG